MKPLILTSRSGTLFMRSDFADLAVIFTSRFVWGPLPSPDELATYLAALEPARAGYSLVGLWRLASSYL